MRQLGGVFRGLSRNAPIQLGGAGFKLLKIELSFQVHETGFWDMFEIGRILMVTMLNSSSTVSLAMVLLQGNLTVIIEKVIKVKPRSSFILSSLC